MALWTADRIVWGGFVVLAWKQKNILALTAWRGLMDFQGLHGLVCRAGKASLKLFMLDQLEEGLHNCRVKMGTGLFTDIVANFLLRPGIPIRPV
jgi:hypothetical protein